ARDARAPRRFRAALRLRECSQCKGPEAVKIVEIDVWKTDGSWRTWVFLRIETDSDLVGYGECTVEGREHAVEGAVKDMRRRLVGRDPRKLRELVDMLTRRGYWDAGPVVSSAVGGIEM